MGIRTWDILSGILGLDAVHGGLGGLLTVCRVCTRDEDDRIFSLPRDILDTSMETLRLGAGVSRAL